MTSSSSGQNETDASAQAEHGEARHTHLSDSAPRHVRHRTKPHGKGPQRRPQMIGDSVLSDGRCVPADGGGLEKTIETQVIPRLLMAHRDGDDACDSNPSRDRLALHTDPVSSVFAATSAAILSKQGAANRGRGRARREPAEAQEVLREAAAGDVRRCDTDQRCATLAHLAVRDSASSVGALLEAEIRAGLSLDVVFLERLAPAARLLGDFWNDDVYSFTDVTVGLCRLRQAFEELRSRLPEPPMRQEHFSVLVSPAPGDQHSFGAAMIAHLFSQAGWSVFNEARGDEDVLLRSLRVRRIDLLGLSLNTDHALERLPGFVLKAKRESKNQDLVIMIGGSLIGARPDIARELGVLAALGDPHEAIEEAEHLVRRAARRM